jgi:hypothetical protein
VKEPFPAELLGRAFRAPNGELAWTRSDAIQAAQVLAAGGFAVLGGEAWVTLDNGQLYGLIPQAKGGPDVVWHWEPDPPERQRSETWDGFCARTGGHTVAFLEKWNAEEQATPDVRPRIRYNLTYVSREDYEALINQTCAR